MPCTSAGNFGTGTPTSSSSRLPTRSIAGNAARRAAVNASPSSGSDVLNTSAAPLASHACRIISISSAAAPPGASERPSSRAPAVRSSPIFTKSSTALMLPLSISSSIDGRSFEVMATTASAAASTEANVATNVHAGGGAGSRRKVNSVMTPRVPSEPTNSFVSDSPATSLRRGPPNRSAVPSASTTTMPST